MGKKKIETVMDSRRMQHRTANIEKIIAEKQCTGSIIIERWNDA